MHTFARHPSMQVETVDAGESKNFWASSKIDAHAVQTPGPMLANVVAAPSCENSKQNSLHVCMQVGARVVPLSKPPHSEKVVCRGDMPASARKSEVGILQSLNRLVFPQWRFPCRGDCEFAYLSRRPLRHHSTPGNSSPRRGKQQVWSEIFWKDIGLAL